MSAQDQIAAVVNRFIPHDKTEQNENGTLRWCSFKVCPNEATSSTIIAGWTEIRACDEHSAEMFRRFS